MGKNILRSAFALDFTPSPLLSDSFARRKEARCLWLELTVCASGLCPSPSPGERAKATAARLPLQTLVLNLLLLLLLLLLPVFLLQADVCASRLALLRLKTIVTWIRKAPLRRRRRRQTRGRDQTLIRTRTWTALSSSSQTM